MLSANSKSIYHSLHFLKRVAKLFLSFTLLIWLICSRLTGTVSDSIIVDCSYVTYLNVSPHLYLHL